MTAVAATHMSQCMHRSVHMHDAFVILEAASLGLHVIGLTYANRSLCVLTQYAQQCKYQEAVTIAKGLDSPPDAGQGQPSQIWAQTCSPANYTRFPPMQVCVLNGLPPSLKLLLSSLSLPLWKH